MTGSVNNDLKSPQNHFIINDNNIDQPPPTSPTLSTTSKGAHDSPSNKSSITSMTETSMSYVPQIFKDFPYTVLLGAQKTIQYCGYFLKNTCYFIFYPFFPHYTPTIQPKEKKNLLQLIQEEGNDPSLTKELANIFRTSKLSLSREDQKVGQEIICVLAEKKREVFKEVAEILSENNKITANSEKEIEEVVLDGIRSSKITLSQFEFAFTLYRIRHASSSNEAEKILRGEIEWGVRSLEIPSFRMLFKSLEKERPDIFDPIMKQLKELKELKELKMPDGVTGEEVEVDLAKRWIDSASFNPKVILSAFDLKEVTNLIGNIDGLPMFEQVAAINYCLLDKQENKPERQREFIVKLFEKLLTENHVGLMKHLSLKMREIDSRLGEAEQFGLHKAFKADAEKEENRDNNDMSSLFKWATDPSLFELDLVIAGLQDTWEGITQAALESQVRNPLYKIQVFDHCIQNASFSQLPESIASFLKGCLDFKDQFILAAAAKLNISSPDEKSLIESIRKIDAEGTEELKESSREKLHNALIEVQSSRIWKEANTEKLISMKLEYWIKIMSKMGNRQLQPSIELFANLFQNESILDSIAETLFPEMEISQISFEEVKLYVASLGKKDFAVKQNRTEIDEFIGRFLQACEKAKNEQLTRETNNNELISMKLEYWIKIMPKIGERQLQPSIEVFADLFRNEPILDSIAKALLPEMESGQSSCEVLKLHAASLQTKNKLPEIRTFLKDFEKACEGAKKEQFMRELQSKSISIKDKLFILQTGLIPKIQNDRSEEKWAVRAMLALANFEPVFFKQMVNRIIEKETDLPFKKEVEESRFHPDKTLQSRMDSLDFAFAERENQKERPGFMKQLTNWWNASEDREFDELLEEIGLEATYPMPNSNEDPILGPYKNIGSVTVSYQLPDEDWDQLYLKACGEGLQKYLQRVNVMNTDLNWLWREVLSQKES